MKFFVLLLEPLCLFGSLLHLSTDLFLPRLQVDQRMLDACRPRSVFRQTFLHAGERMRGRRACARPRCEQLRRHLGGITQRPERIAVEREHGAERLFVDVGRNRSVAYKTVGIAHAGKLRFLSRSVSEKQRAGTLAVFRLVRIARAPRVFPSEQNTAHERGQRGFARFVRAAHDVQAGLERADHLVGESSVACYPDMLEMQGGKGLSHARPIVSFKSTHEPSPRLSKSRTRSFASRDKQPTCLATEPGKWMPRFKNSSCR